MASQINKTIKDNLVIIIFSVLIFLAIISPNFNFFGTRINLEYAVALMSMLIILQALKPMVESMDKNYAVILFGTIAVVVFIFILFYVTILFR
jgi:hypothetical protein